MQCKGCSSNRLLWQDNSYQRSQPPLPLLIISVFGLQLGDLITSGLLAARGPPLPIAGATSHPKKGPPIVVPLCSCGLLCCTERAAGGKVGDSGRNQDGRRAPDPPPSCRMSTPKRGPLKRLFRDESSDTSMSMIVSCMTSIIGLPIFRERAGTQSSSTLVPLFLSILWRNQSRVGSRCPSLPYNTPSTCWII